MPKTLPVKLLLKSLFLLVLFLSSGVIQAQTATPYVVDNSNTDYNLVKAVGLPSGKSAVIFRDNSYNYKCSIVGSNGAVTNTFDFTSKMALQNIPSRIEVNALGTSSGNIFITYTSFTSDGPPNSINAKFLVLDQSGTLVNSGTVNGSNLGSTLNRFIQMDQLSNGNVVMVWLESDNMSGGYRIFTSNGTPVTNDASFAGPASTIFHTSNTQPILWGNRVAANPTGGFLITFFYSSGNFQGILFDNNGAVQQVGGSNAFTIDPTIPGSYSNFSAVGLSNGNYMIAWSENSSGTDVGYYKIISATGSIIKAKTAMPTDMQINLGYNGWVGFAANNTSSNQGFVMASYLWQDFNDFSNPYLKVVYYNYDMSGNYVSSNDASSYYIGDYNPFLSIYSGSPSGVGVAYVNYKSYTPITNGYNVSGEDISGSLVGFPGGLSNNSSLSNLTISSGTLSPAFASGTTAYTASVSNATSTITVTPTVAESHATVTVNTTPVTSGSASGAISLAVGANTITVKVTAQDGTTISTYTITVTRAAAPSITSTGSFSALNTTYGISSAYSSINVSGTNLTAGITATVSPSVFELSSDGTTFASSVSIGSSGSASGTIYVRLKSTAAAGTYTGSVSLSSTGANNPTIAIPSSTVSKALLTILVDPKSKTYGSANPTLTATYNGFLNGDNSSTLTTLPTIITSATTTSNVGSYSITASGAVSSNYTFSYVQNSLTVTPAGLVITANNVNKTYGQSLGGGTGSTAFSQTGLVNGETIGSVTVTYGTGASATDAVGTYTGQVTPSAPTGGTFNPSNYSIFYLKGDITVVATAATISFTSLPAKSYGNGDFGPGATSDNATTPITYTSSNTSVATIVSGKIHIIGAGTTTITASQAAGNSYSAAADKQQTLTVNPAALTIIADDRSKVYGSAIPTLTASYSGFVNGDNASNLTTPPTMSTTAITGSSVGSYSITASGASSSNYTINYTAGNLTVTPAALIITANDQSKVYGAGVPVLAASYSGFVNGETPSSLTTQPTLTTTATTSSSVGNYTITASSAVDPNYTISYVPGNLAVIPADLTITANNVNKNYGQTLGGGTGSTAFSQNGLANGETIGSVTIGYGTGAAAIDAVGTYTKQVTPSAATGGTFNPNNYSIIYAKGDITVNAATSTITFPVIPDKIYGDADFAAGATSTNTGTQVTYMSSNPSVATIVSNKIHITGVGTTTITATQSADANHSAAADQQQSLNVGQKTLILTLNSTPAISKIYDGTNAATLGAGNYILNGLVGTDAVTVSSTATYNDANAGTGKTVTANNFILAGAQKDNYILSTTSATTTGFISARQVTVTADAKTKVYGQSDPAQTYTASPALLIGDSFTGSLTRDAGENAGTYAIKQGTLNAGNNYSLTYAGANLTIDQAQLTITANNKSKVYGTPNPVLTVSYSGFVNGDNASSLTTAPTITTLATVSSAVGSYAINVNGAASSNYAIAYGSGTLTVTVATPTISFNALPVKTYGDADFDAGATSDNESTSVTYSCDNTNVAVIVNGKVHIVGAGTANITASQAADANHTAATDAVQQLIVNKKAITVVADTKNKTYGQSDPALTYQITSGALVGTDGFTGSLTRSAGEQAGSYAIKQGTLALNDNYTLTYNSADLTINKAAITVTADTKTKIYGESDPAMTYQVTSGALVGIDAFSGQLTRDGGENTGIYAIRQGTLALSDNYSLTYAGANLTINKAALTITAENKSKVYGAANPELTVSYSGFVGGDQASSLTTAPALATTATTGSPVGNYTITASGAASANYSISYVGGNLSVTQATLTITADHQTKVYGQDNPVLSVSYNGFVNGDDESKLTTAAVAATTANKTSGAGSYDITVSGAASPDYMIVYNSGTLTITQSELTVTADDKTKVYGSSNPALTLSYSGFVNGDDVSVLATQPLAAVNASTTSDVGSYAITPSGGISNNYSFNYVNGNLTITAKALTVSANALTKIYGDADPALTYNIYGLVGSDAVTGVLVRAGGEHVGTYAILQGSLSAGANYVVAYQGADLTITPKPVTVTADAQSKTYGQSDPDFTYNISPALISGDVLGGTLNRAAGEDAGNYVINQGSLNNPDYTISFTGNILTINKATQQITWVQNLTMGCDGVTRSTLSATASSGLPVSYSSADASIATINGNEVAMTGPGTVILTASQPGNQNYLPATSVTNTLINKLPSSMVVKRWDDVLVFDNSSNQYSGWQWYKNGTAVSGANGQYYYESGKLNGVYNAVAKTKTGATLQTCPVTITPGSTIIPISIFPNPVAPGQTVLVKTDYSSTELQGATIVVSNMLGVVIQTVQNVTPQTNVTMPVAQGMYVIRLRLANGVTAAVNALVKPQ